MTHSPTTIDGQVKSERGISVISVPHTLTTTINSLNLNGVYASNIIKRTNDVRCQEITSKAK
jgi:hypothetical protein